MDEMLKGVNNGLITPDMVGALFVETVKKNEASGIVLEAKEGADIFIVAMPELFREDVCELIETKLEGGNC